jgi:hypothetical protein
MFPLPYKNVLKVPHAAKCGRHFHLSFRYKMYQRVPPTLAACGTRDRDMGRGVYLAIVECVPAPHDHHRRGQRLWTSERGKDGSFIQVRSKPMKSNFGYFGPKWVQKSGAFCTGLGIKRTQIRFKLISTALTAVIRYGTRHNNIERFISRIRLQWEAACIREAEGKHIHQREATCMHT